jgi:hypothetical protein
VRKSEELVERLEAVAYKWIDAIWRSAAQDISTLAVGRDGILAHPDVAKVARLALKLKRTVSTEDFPRLLVHDPNHHHRETLTSVLEVEVDAWDNEETARSLAKHEQRVEAYKKVEQERIECHANPDNVGLDPPEHLQTPAQRKKGMVSYS